MIIKWENIGKFIKNVIQEWKSKRNNIESFPVTSQKHKFN